MIASLGGGLAAAVEKIAAVSPMRAFQRHESGNFAVVLSLAAPLILGAGYYAINLTDQNSQRGIVQAAADAAALAGAQQMSLSNVGAAAVQQTATSFAKANLPVAANLALPDQIVASADMTNALVTVSIVRTVSPILSALNSTPTTISASATAQYRSAPICVLALSSSGVAFDAKAASNLTASGCAILSNSTATDGLTAHTNGLVSSQKTCSAGGYSGNSFSPTPITDCPGSADPLASRSPPSNVNDACQYTDYAFSDGALPLTPGVYCGGIAIKHGAAMFMPGDYIIRGGTLEIKAGGSMNGVDVGFYLTGGANLAAQANSALSLEAPSDPDDPMVGLVFWEDPHNMPAGSAATHTIDADNGQNLHGTVYFPQGSLYIGGNAKVGAASAYTIIVANNLVVDQQANVVLNSNYTASAIPAPQGVGNTGGTAYLAQ